MKLRLLLLTGALLSFSYVAPWTFSQNQGSANPTDPNASDSTVQSDQGTPPPPGVQPADPDKVKHDGGKNDVDAIGNRKMGGRGLGNWYSIESDIKMGKQYAQMGDS